MQEPHDMCFVVSVHVPIPLYCVHLFSSRLVPLLKDYLLRDFKDHMASVPSSKSKVPLLSKGSTAVDSVLWPGL
jgi:hypothetical protein